MNHDHRICYYASSGFQVSMKSTTELSYVYSVRSETKIMRKERSLFRITVETNEIKTDLS